MRDKRMVEVYHQLSDIKRMKSEDVLRVMEQEIFFIDAKHIYKTIFYNKDNQAYYDRLLGGADIEKAVVCKLKEVTNQLKLL